MKNMSGKLKQYFELINSFRNNKIKVTTIRGTLHFEFNITIIDQKQ